MLGERDGALRVRDGDSDGLSTEPDGGRAATARAAGTERAAAAN
jgi:hypothetical protein